MKKTITIITLIGLIFAMGCTMTMKAGLTEQEVYRFKLGSDDPIITQDGREIKRPIGAYESFVRDGVVFLRGTMTMGETLPRVTRKPGENKTFTRIDREGRVLYAAYDSVTGYVYIFRNDVRLIHDRIRPRTTHLFFPPYLEEHITVKVPFVRYFQLEGSGINYFGFPCPIGSQLFLSDTNCSCCFDLIHDIPITSVKILVDTEELYGKVLDEKFREGDYGNWWGYFIYVVEADASLKEIFKKLKNKEKITWKEIDKIYAIQDTSIISKHPELINLNVRFWLGKPSAEVSQGPYGKIWEMIQYFRKAVGVKK